jgi:hypothetical protein
LQVLRGVGARDRLETARRLRAIICSVFRFAVATGRASNDSTTALRGALRAMTDGRRAAIVEPAAIGELLRAVDVRVPLREHRSTIASSGSVRR